MIVPGEGKLESKIWLIGEAPGPNEEKHGKPFCGGAGNILEGILKGVGIQRSDCYIDNVMQERPTGNNFGAFYADKARYNPKDILLKRHHELKALIQKHRPNVVVALGNEPLYALTGNKSILKWRGSILNCHGTKVIPTVHPAAVMRMFSLQPIASLDFQRIKVESESPTLPTPYQDIFKVNPSFGEVMHYLEEVLPKQSYLAFDIETLPDKEAIMCIGFAWSKQTAICIPLFFSTSSWWSIEEEMAIIKAICKLFDNTSIKFIAQNAQYDLTYIYDKWRASVPGLWMDTMIAFHCVYPELRKSLAFLTSVYTKRPYYKDDGGQGKTPEQEWIYNCKDVCATYECAMAIYKELEEFKTLELYQKIPHKLILPLLRMQSKGIMINEPKQKQLSKELGEKEMELQARMEKALGKPLNPFSPKQMKEFLYEDLCLPKQFKMGTLKGKRVKVVTADEEAIIVLQKLTDNPVLSLVLEIRGLRKLRSTYVDAKLERNGRMCCSYFITGTETGRLSSKKSIYGRGTNLQNVPRLPVIRSMFIADPGMLMINADLSQAEARIVSHLAEDARMQRLFEEGGDIHTRNAAMIFGVTTDKVQKPQRQIAKSLVHGANYGIGKDKFAKLIGSTPNKAQGFLNQYHNLYMGLRLWHLKVQEHLGRTRIMRTPLGRARMFFGRWSQELVREAIAYVPQSTVGDLLNWGIVRCWNALPPKWELLMQNHDAVVAQVPEDTPPEQIVKFFKHYYEIPFEVNGKMIKIPIDIKIGKNWGEMKELKI